MTFTEEQPQRGEIVALCAHHRHQPDDAVVVWFKGEGMVRQDGGDSESFDWICCCEACALSLERDGMIHLVEFMNWGDGWNHPDEPIIEQPVIH